MTKVEKSNLLDHVTMDSLLAAPKKSSILETGKVEKVANETFRSTSIAATITGAGCVITDIHSGGRNSLDAATKILGMGEKVTKVLAGSATIGSLFGTISATHGIIKAAQNISKAVEIGDSEGILNEVASGTASASYLGLSAAFGVESILTLASTSIPVFLDPMMTGTGIAMYSAFLIQGICGFVASANLGSSLKEAVTRAVSEENDEPLLKWFQNKLTLTDADFIEEIQGGDEPEESDEPLTLDPAEVAKENANILATKKKAFERRTGLSGQDIDAICECIDKEDIKALKTEWVPKIEEGIFKTKTKNMLLIIVSLLGIITFIASIFTGGVAIPVLFGIGAILWLMLDSKVVNNFVSDRLWKWFGNAKPIDPERVTLLSKEKIA